MVVSPNIQPSRQMDGYWLDWFSSDPSSASWDWYADSAQRNLMWKARDRGANIFELFSNSPMWWMCTNHNPSGNADGTKDNLQSWNYQQHAVYLATIAKYTHDHWGLNFHSVDAFNEPSSAWWTAAGTQEGCHFDVSTQKAVINYLRSELNARGLGDVLVAASDETSYDLARSTWAGLDATTKSQVSKVNVHGYQYGGGRRDLLYNAVHADGKVLWNSEYGEGDASGLSLTSNLNLDFRWLHPPPPGFLLAGFRRWRLGTHPGRRGRRHHWRGQPEILCARPVLPAYPARHADHRRRRSEHGRRVRLDRPPAGDRHDKLRHRPVDQLRPVQVRLRARRQRRRPPVGHRHQRDR
ncbi:glycoside hydrolase [Fodinicola feengrottensis]|uniref:glycoside hydrolase n=1 Tax=Fodinicola feengrottensis TaxID=435914 RepID=UPI0028BECA15|nr:glycoside hydrolase [Fodinicola feengrottensis]